MSRRKVTTTIAFTPEQLAGLRECSARTRVPIAEIVREGVELALQARAERVPATVEPIDWSELQRDAERWDLVRAKGFDQ